ncbi:hypothetical protein Tco_0857972, partial [Tanacetum coccineum]
FERPAIVEEMLKDLQSDLKYTSPTLIAVEADQVENLTRQLKDQAGGFTRKSVDLYMVTHKQILISHISCSFSCLSMGQPVEGGLDPILVYTAGAEIE